MLPSKLISPLVRAVMLATLVAAVFLWSATPALAAGGPTPTSSSSPTPSPCSGKSCPTPTSGPRPNIFPNDTGQYAKGKPAIAYCNGRLYVGWAGTDSQATLNVGWGATGGPFSNVVTFHGVYAYQNTNANPSIYTGPALICLSLGHGTQLYIAYADQNAKLHVGYFDGNPGNPNIQANFTVNNNTSYSTPALTYDGSYLRLAWTGTNGVPCIIRSSDGQNWGAQNNWSGQAATGGPGFVYGGNPYYSVSLYITWIGTDSAHSLNLGRFNLSSGTFSKLLTFSNYSGVGNDSSFADISSTFYLPYTGNTGDLNVLISPPPSWLIGPFCASGSIWCNDEPLLRSGRGASIAYNANDGQNYMVWVDETSFNNALAISSYP